MKSKTTAALLAFFLGGIGIHKLYLGQVGLFVLYLLFCWTFIPAIIAFIEFFILISMEEWKFDEKYNKENMYYKMKREEAMRKKYRNEEQKRGTISPSSPTIVPRLVNT